MSSEGDDATLSSRVIDALRASVDERAFASLLKDALPKSPPSETKSPSKQDESAHLSKSVANALLEKWSLADVLDDSILGANPGDKSYPLRLLFAEMSAKMNDSDEALAFASATNFFFRCEGDEETKLVVGIAVSRAFYEFARTLERELLARAAPNFAALLSTQLERLKFESVDHLATFDSQLHERERGAGASGDIREVRTFACRITATGLIRTKARVLT